MNDLPRRKNIRLKDYDYSQNGAYFVTICVKDRHEMLGEIVGAGSARPLSPVARPYCKLSKYGKIVENEFMILSDKYPTITVDKYMIMPNHVHGIIIINGRADPINGRADPAPTIGQIMGYYKYQTTKKIDITGFWQRSYHDHIVRNEQEYQQIWQYIDENPIKWEEDEFYGNT